MKKILIGVSFFLIYLLFSISYAGGGMTHMFLARESISKITNPELRSLLQNNIDAYLVGAYYPDSGYILGNDYGEDSHWDPFIYSFVDYLKETYPYPAAQNPRLVAFLFGCAAHRVSDEVIHWTFYPVMQKKDFNGNLEKAHQYGDTGIDLLLNIDKNQWYSHPSTWWVPVKDLVNVYKRMGKSQYTADKIIFGNRILSLAGFGERLISVPAYLYLQWRMPWTANHYYNWPQGGMLMDIDKIAEYQMDLWQRLNNRSVKGFAGSTNVKKYRDDMSNLPMLDFAKSAVQSGVVRVETKSNNDGSVEIQPPVVSNARELQNLLDRFIAKLTK